MINGYRSKECVIHYLCCMSDILPGVNFHCAETSEQMKDMCLHQLDYKMPWSSKSIYIYDMILIWKNRLIATKTLKQKGRVFNWKISSTQKPPQQECYRAAWWPLWAEYGPYRGTLGVGEQLWTGSSYSCRAGGRKGCTPLQRDLRTKWVQKPLKIMKILRRCGINQQFPMGKNLLKQQMFLKLYPPFEAFDIVTLWLVTRWNSYLQV